VAPEDRHQLFRSDQHDEQLGGGGDDFLADQSAAVALDELELRIDFVGAIEGNFQFGHVGEGCQRDAELAGQISGGLRCGHTPYLKASLDALAQGLDERRGGTPRAEAECLTVADVSQGLFCDVHGATSSFCK
jgi:hypothetical protein